MSKIFLHVPKTAGTSLLVALRRHLRQDELLEYYDNQPGKSFAEIQPRAARAHLVYGHASHGIHQELGVAPRYGIILREPVARVRSLYHHMARDPQSEHHDRFRKGLSLADFVELRLTNQTRNHMTQIAAGIESDVLDDAALWQAQDNLSCFDYVGILEALDHTALEAFFGVPPLEIGQHNVGTYAREPLSGRDRSVVERCNAYDLELYRHAVGLARSRRRAAGRRSYDLGAAARRPPEPVAGPRPEPSPEFLPEPSPEFLPEPPPEPLAEPLVEACASRMSRAERATRTCLEETAEVATLRERARQQERLVLALGALLAEQREHRRRAEAALLDREAAMEAVIATVRTSRSWRLTRPLRRLRGASADDIPVPAAPAPAPAALSALPGRAASPGRAALEATGLFDVAWYLEENTDVALLADDPLEHYLAFGAAEGRSPHPLFDPAFYGAQQPALPAGANPLLHYCTEGAAALRDPGPLFSTSFYLEANPDVRQAGMNPLWHFCEHGLLEGRRPHPDLRPALPQLAPFDPARPREAVRWLARRAKAAGLAEARLAAAKRLWRQQAEAQLAAFLRGAARLALPRAARPRLSVILVLYNQAALTLDCLRALAAGGGPPMETIIVDNGSTDETVALLRRLDGARILRNPGNPGYAAAVNQAAGIAAGEFLLLLNNDALVEPGTIQAAMAAIEGSADIGAVGGRVLLADGTLQEAGCLVWNDGGCHGYGRGDDPERGEYRFRREVDFCSGVFLLLRRAAFGAVGGFDEAFAPAYYEDVDLCVRLREAGYRTLYEPDAVLRHYEFGSSAERAVALQQLARPRFVAKHEAWLGRRPQPDLRNLLRGRTVERRGRQRILLVDDAVPHGWLGGGLPRARHLALALAARGRFLTLYTTIGAEPDWPAVRATLGAEVEVIPGSRAALPSFLAGRQGCYDTIVVSRPHNMQAFNRHAEADPAALRGVRLVYDAEAVFAVRGIRAARLAGRPLAAEAAEAAIAEEIRLAARADQVLVVSEEEAEHFRGRVPAPVSVLTHAIAPRPGAAAFAQRRGLLFVGPLSEEGSPNVDAVTWFVTEILPLIRARIGAVQLRIAGRVTVPRIERLAGDGVHLLGTVQDLTALYEASRLLVAPARFAAGVPAKVIEAGAHGLPAVATGLLAQQLGWIPGTELLAAADAASFADACIELHEDPVTWDNLRQAALARVAADYAPEDFAAGVERILAR